MSQTWAQASLPDHVRYTMLVELLLDSGALRMHSGAGYIAWNGVDWGGVGGFGNVSTISGGIDLESHEIELTLAGVPEAHREELMSALTRGDRVNIYHGFWDYDAGAWARPPELEFAGFISHPTLRDEAEDNATATVSITVLVLSAFAYARRRTIARRTSAHQQSLFAGDEFYAFKTDVAKPAPRTGEPAQSNILQDARTRGHFPFFN